MTKATYQIECNAKQAHVLNRAVEFYSRLMMGQLEEVADLIQQDKEAGESFDTYIYRRDRCRLYLDLAKRSFIGKEYPCGNLGIHSRKISDDARIAFDIYQVVRHQLYRDGTPNPGPWCVWNDTPRRLSETQTSLVTIKKI